MTTYQDQPLSRRAMREREAEAARAAASSADAPEGAAPEGAPEGTTTPEPLTPEPLTYVTQGRTPLPQYDAPVAPEQPSAGPQADAASADEASFRYRDYSPEGRRAARLGWPPAAAESADLDYRTQGRADVPPVPEQVVPEQVVPEAAPAVSEAGLSRRELRALREAQDREAGIVPPSDEPVGYASAPPVSTSPAYAPPVSAPPAYVPTASAAPVSAPDEAAAPAVGPEWLAAFAPPAAAGTAAPVEPPTAPAFDDILIGETVDDDVDADADGPVVVAEQVREVPPPLIEPAAPPTDALASFEAMFRGDTGVTPAQTTTPPTSVPSASPVFAAPPVASAPPTYTAPPSYTTPPAYSAPVTTPPVTTPPAPAAQSAASVVEPPVEQPFAAPHTQSFAPFADGPQPASAAPTTAANPLNLAFIPAPPTEAPGEQAAEQLAPEAPATPSQPPVPGERPRNHWSRQAELDDEAPETGSISRSVGGAPATASALVLPEIPSPDLMSTPLTSTGDVLVTGSISLPASLSSTGALPTQLDESDLDHLLDPGDHQVASTDSQPVRAIRAVSTHTSSREIIGTIKPKRSNRALTALIISAAGMAVVVVTLLVVALVSGVLG